MTAPEHLTRPLTAALDEIDRLRAENAALKSVGRQIIRYGTGDSIAYYGLLGDWDRLVLGDLHGDPHENYDSGTRWGDGVALTTPATQDGAPDA